MFIDTSVIVAILSKEDDAAALAERIEAASCMTSSLVILESVMRLVTKPRLDPLLVEARVWNFIAEARVALAPLDAGTASLAVGAFADYGKGCGLWAQLNLADCLSHACAMAQAMPLIYKGNEFLCTDLA